MNLPVENPFSTRFIRPGAVEFIFPPGEDAAQLAARLAESNYRAEIIGPHGVGKSTLLSTLIPEIERRGRSVYHCGLHDGQRRLSQEFVEAVDWSDSSLVVVDGYEQLSVCSRWLLKRKCRKSGAGLLVTAHRRMGLSLLYEIQPTARAAQVVVEKLLEQSPFEISAQEIARSVSRNKGNLRETLFELYDLYERERMKNGGRKK